MGHPSFVHFPFCPLLRIHESKTKASYYSSLDQDLEKIYRSDHPTRSGSETLILRCTVAGNTTKTGKMFAITKLEPALFNMAALAPHCLVAPQALLLHNVPALQLGLRVAGGKHLAVAIVTVPGHHEVAAALSILILLLHVLQKAIRYTKVRGVFEIKCD